MILLTVRPIFEYVIKWYYDQRSQRKYENRKGACPISTNESPRKSDYVHDVRFFLFSIVCLSFCTNLFHSIESSPVRLFDSRMRVCCGCVICHMFVRRSKCSNRLAWGCCSQAESVEKKSRIKTPLGDSSRSCLPC